jgi:hypothetical protein
VVHERITRLEGQLQDRTVGAEHFTTLKVRAGRLARAQEQLTTRQARIATLETQVQQLQQIAEQARSSSPSWSAMLVNWPRPVCSSPRWNAACSHSKSRRPSPACSSACSVESERAADG